MSLSKLPQIFLYAHLDVSWRLLISGSEDILRISVRNQPSPVCWKQLLTVRRLLMTSTTIRYLRRRITKNHILVILPTTMCTRSALQSFVVVHLEC